MVQGIFFVASEELEAFPLLCVVHWCSLVELQYKHPGLDAEGAHCDLLTDRNTKLEESLFKNICGLKV